jgi:hypothetical protein
MAYVRKQFTNACKQNNPRYLIICRHTFWLFQIFIRCRHSSPFNIVLVYSLVSSAHFPLLPMVTAVWRHFLTLCHRLFYSALCKAWRFVPIYIYIYIYICLRYFSSRVFFFMYLTVGMNNWTKKENESCFLASHVKDNRQVHLFARIRSRFHKLLFTSLWRRKHHSV